MILLMGDGCQVPGDGKKKVNRIFFYRHPAPDTRHLLFLSACGGQLAL
jgi:hypothetical protein